MRPIAILALVLAVVLASRPPEGRAQQPGPSTAARRGYYTRVQTESARVSTSTDGSTPRLRFDRPGTAGGRGGVASNPEAFRGGLDPLRIYGSDAREVAMTRPYEPKPTVAPPGRPAPAPATPHNYFPSLRPGQGPNRNGMAHCVPGRAALLHR